MVLVKSVFYDEYRVGFRNFRIFSRVMWNRINRWLPDAYVRTDGTVSRSAVAVSYSFYGICLLNLHFPALDQYIQFSGSSIKDVRDMVIIPNFVTVEEESSLVKEIEESFKHTTTRYEYSHWDNVITDLLYFMYTV